MTLDKIGSFNNFRLEQEEEIAYEKDSGSVSGFAGSGWLFF